MRRLLARLREPSTMAGLSALALLAGESVERAAAWATAAGAVLAVLAVVLPEHGGDRGT